MADSQGGTEKEQPKNFSPGNDASQRNRGNRGRGRFRRGGGGGGGGVGGRGPGGDKESMPQNVKNESNPHNISGEGDRRERRRPLGGSRFGEGGNPRNAEDRFNERLSALMGPTYELPPVDNSEKKFAGRSRLYIGNISSDTTDDELLELFKPFGETSELFVNREKNFGFIRFDYRTNAEKAKQELDGTVKKGRTLKIRFSPSGSAVKIKNLTPWVSNELLSYAFSIFGDIEHCAIIVDDRGKSTGEGIIEFSRKPAAASAVRQCAEGCFFLTSSLRPVIVEMHEQVDMTEGYPEKNLLKKGPDFYAAREYGPRFATMGSFEHEYGTRWKHLYELFKQKQLALKEELAMEEDKLEAQMQFAKFESETEMLREQLRLRELDRERQKREWEERERVAEEARLKHEEIMLRQQKEMEMRIHLQEEDVRRRQQENSLFMQAHQLSSMLDQQEEVMQCYESPTEKRPDDMRPDFDASSSGRDNKPVDPKHFMNMYDRNTRYEGRGGREDGGSNRGMMGRRDYDHDDRRDDFHNKRRRY